MLRLLHTVPVIFLAVGSVSSAGELYDAALAGSASRVTEILGGGKDLNDAAP
jgi:hypothetical protein